MQAVWTSWMRANSRATTDVPMLLESSEQPALPSTPRKNTKRTAEERSPAKAESACGAAHASPQGTGGKQPRSLTYAAAVGGDGDYKTWSVIDLRAELKRRDLDTKGTKQELVVPSAKQALPSPPPRPLREPLVCVRHEHGRFQRVVLRTLGRRWVPRYRAMRPPPHAC